MVASLALRLALVIWTGTAAVTVAEVAATVLLAAEVGAAAVPPVGVVEHPTQIEAIWHKLLRAFTYVGTRGATTAMISGIDIALWDIKGQILGVPIYELLGGAVRNTIPLYTHFQYAPTVEDMVKNALH